MPLLPLPRLRVRRFVGQWSLLLLLLLGGALPAWPQARPARAAVPITGFVRTDIGEPLPGATLLLKATFLCVSTNASGAFELRLPAAEYAPGQRVVVSCVGYESREIELPDRPGQPLDVVLTAALTPRADVVAAASRVEEKALQAPVTVDKVGADALRQQPSPDLQQGLRLVRGVDANGTGLLTSSLSTRGFNAPTSGRLVQLTDYFDTQLPSLSANVGNLTGLPEVDVASVELIQGPASALYGANAFNGVLQLNTRDAFTAPGLQVRVRGGERNLLDGQIRWAERLSRRVALKVVGSYTSVRDFLPDNRDATAPGITPQNNPAGSSLGYEAVNRYGAVFATAPTSLGGQPNASVHPELAGKTLFMPGFSEQDLVQDDDHARQYRVQPTLSVLLTERVKATASASLSRGTSAYQTSSRYRLRDLGANQYRAELRGSHWVVRGSATEDFGGRSYNLNQLGAALQDQPVAEGGTTTYRQLYAGTYYTTYTSARQQGQTQEQAQRTAQQAANATQLDPTSARFRELRDQLIADDTPGRGARLNVNSWLTDLNGQYDRTLGPHTGLVAGAAYRRYALGSGSTLFDDRAGHRRPNYEYGTYAQLTRGLLADDRLKLAVALRADDFRNFDAAFSPRFSATLGLGRQQQHNLRASYGTAYRSPTQLDQYGHADQGSGVLLGNVGAGFTGYGLGILGENGAGGAPGDSLTLQAVHIAPLKLERVATFEVGYRAALGERFYVDVNYFRSTYNDFVGTFRLLTNTDGSLPTAAQLVAGQSSLYQDPNLPTRVVLVAGNIAQRVHTQGTSASLRYAFGPAAALSGTYTLSLLNRADLPSSDFQAGFNTPRHKFNLGVSGAVLPGRRLSYKLTYAWAEGYRYESAFALGRLPGTRVVDASVGYNLRRLNTTVQAGASNLFNGPNTQVYGGPNQGRLLSLGLAVDVK